MSKYEFLAVEEEMLAFWKENDTHRKANSQNAGKKKFYFLDGPPYTSGRVHIGTAWNKTLKDIALRYKRMKGFDVWDRAGYDMHGMPIERAVQQELKLKGKEKIIEFGVDKFTEKCLEFANRNMELMNKDFKRLGVWMDFEDAYQPITREYIEGEWWLIKRAHENGRLYQGKKTMTWCGDCGTALAKHELEYKNVTDQSIFLKFKVLGKEDEYLIIWTTTPWTIPYNLGVMVNPELEYVKANVEGETWIVAKALVNVFVSALLGKTYEIVEEFKGEKLKGLKYIHPLREELEANFREIEKVSDKVHSVVMSEEYVDTSAGTGLVHMAPGCGPEDYEVGHREGIPPFNELDQEGVFRENMGPFAGWVAKKDDKKFVQYFEDKGCLIEKTPVDHDYAHCWRCKQPIVFRTTTQWFFKVEDLKETMRELNRGINWVPDFAGSKSFDNWLDNLRDNGITRQRFWGTPLPVWKCDSCGEYIVVGSMAELKELAGSVPDDLHKPWIDEITMSCECGGVKKRIPDILDVWVDSGTASWNCLRFPQDDTLFKEMFPPDFILEGIDQIRGWFNLLMVASMVSMGKPSFKNVYMHGFVQDCKGRKMSKSLGNYILPEEVISKYGADTFRYYSSGATAPGIDLNYNFDDMEVKFRNLGVLWNLHNFVLDLANNTGKDPTSITAKKEALGLEEKYIISKMHSVIKDVTLALDSYRLNEAEGKIERLYFELSRTYIQLVRDKASVGTDEEKEAVLATIWEVLMKTIRMFSIICPFITEKMHGDFKERFGLPEESVHFLGWPTYDEKLIDKSLEDAMEIVAGVIQATLHAREKTGLGLRWPVKELTVVTKDDAVKAAVERLEAVVVSQTNIKSLRVKTEMEGVGIRVKPDHGKLGPDYGELVPKIIAKLVAMDMGEILSAVEKEGKYAITIGDRDVDIRKEHLVVERDVPGHLHETEFRNGAVYLDKTRDEGLDAEGFAREAMRRVQSLRKKEGLEKADTIDLYIKAGENLAKCFESWKQQIGEKVGAKSVTISTKEPTNDHKSMSKEKVKGESFEIHFS